MTQIAHGLRAVLSHPIVYSSIQTVMGAHKARRNFVRNYVAPFPGMNILDVGCGPADILAYLPPVAYRGFDISADYIAHARKRFGARGKFSCKQLQMEDLAGVPPFDVVLALGLLHHLGDAKATEVMRLAWEALKPGGKLLTIDPCIAPSQNVIARFLIRNDRGGNVRDKAGYEALARSFFASLRVEVRHRAWIPYTHCLMVCQK